MFYISVTLSDAKPRVKALSTIGLHLWQLARSIEYVALNYAFIVVLYVDCAMSA